MMKTGRLSWRDDWLEPLCAARRELFGERAGGAPRFLVRVDEFPSATRFYDSVRGEADATRRFHEAMLAAGVPYLMAVLPEPALEPLNPRAMGTRALTAEELELLSRLQADGVAFAQHGTTHRTRQKSPRQRSELAGLTAAELASFLDRGREILERHGIWARVFVPPFNRFDARQYDVLAERFDVICGGPESGFLCGFPGRSALARRRPVPAGLRAALRSSGRSAADGAGDDRATARNVDPDRAAHGLGVRQRPRRTP